MKRVTFGEIMPNYWSEIQTTSIEPSHKCLTLGGTRAQSSEIQTTIIASCTGTDEKGHFWRKNAQLLV